MYFYIFHLSVVSWTDWTNWTDCSINCGQGSMARYRDCEYADASLADISLCPGDDEETKPCHSECRKYLAL